MSKIAKLLVLVGLFISCASMLVSCGEMKLTPEEKAARQEAAKKSVAESIIHRHYRINVTSMTPLRAETMYVSGCWIKIDSTMVDCSIPYMGLDDTPHFKTPGEARMDSKMVFTAEMEDYYVELQPEQNSIFVSFKTGFRGISYTFKMLIQDVNQARINVVPDDRDEIFYEGNLYPKE